jgi:hypothetical protein
MMEHVFISYARKDGEAHALQFDSELPKRGFSTWRDRRGIDPTQDFTAEIEKAIEASSYVVTCITPDVRREDSFVRREIAYAQVINKPIIVARFADVPPPISVVSHTWLDFFKGWENAFKQLCDLLKQPSGSYTPPPPSSDDPYKPYLEALYKQIVRYLDKTVFSMLPGQSNTALITLQSEDTPEAVNPPEEIEAQALPLAFFDMAGVGDESPQATTYHSFHDAFDKYEGRVLLLGEPGAGKTTTLFAFARDKVAQRLQDTTQPLPILAPIALWDAEKQPPLSEWLAQTIPALKNDLSQILNDSKALLLLDGLDELGDERENQKTKEAYDPRQRFMHFIPENNQVLISCRIKDYNDIDEKLPLKGAVTLYPLDDAQMQIYLKDTPELWYVVQKDDELREVARTPLLLSFFTFAFAGLDEEAKQLKDLSKGDVRDKIFETYVRRRYDHEERKALGSGKKLPFTLTDLYEELGYDAVMILSGQGTAKNIIFATSATHKYKYNSNEARNLQLIISFAIQLHLLIPIEGGNYRFIHLLLRDHFAFRCAMKSTLQQGELTQRAISAFGEMKDIRAIEFLIKVLNNESMPMLARAEAANSLGLLGNQEATNSLIAALGDKERWVRFQAARALGKLRSVMAIDSLIFALFDKDEWVRFQAARALDKIGDNRAVEPFIRVLRERDEITLYVAIRALGKLGDIVAVEPLVEMLNEDSPRIRIEIARALGQLKDNRAVQALKILLSDMRQTKDGRVCDTILNALQAIATPEALAAVEAWKHQKSQRPDNVD